MATDRSSSVVDREKVCPFLLRCFWSLHKSHSAQDYRDAPAGILPKNEVQIYTWPDATLREISNLMKDVVPGAGQPNSQLVFSLVYPDKDGNSIIKQVGRVFSNRNGNDDDRALGSLSFQTGDYLDVTVYLSRQSGGR